ncbi:MAG: LuxR C-terminal-related transcriptional regulator, partial [Phycisphaerales bacterium]|nr:LuxR C-terminal-related transcriptional regulator [Phycisphaerales bacterium]
LAAILPMLSQRVCKAFSAESEDRMAWLTPREEVVMWHLVAGLKVPQIAEILHRSIYTVHDHVKSLHRKLNANNRGQLVARALGHLGPIDLHASATGDEASPKVDAEGKASGAGMSGPRGADGGARRAARSSPAAGAGRRSSDR